MGSSKHEEVRAGGHQQRERGAGALAGREAAGVAVDLVRLQPELGQQRARVLQRHAALLDERVDQRVGAVEAGAGLVERADAHARADPARAGAQLQLRRSGPGRASSCRTRSGPTSATRSPHASSTVSGPRAKVPRCMTAPSRRTVTSPERSPPPKRSCSSQRFQGLSTTSSRSSAFSDARPCRPASPSARRGGARRPCRDRSPWTS